MMYAIDRYFRHTFIACSLQGFGNAGVGGFDVTNNQSTKDIHKARR